MEQLESIPGYDIVMDKYNEYGEEHFNRFNPFEDENGNRRRLNGTAQQQAAWKRIQKQAWVHDRCFLGSCGVGMDCGLGLVPLAVFLLPGIGPVATYAVHARLIHIAEEEFYMPEKLVMKLQANILLDLLISLPPVIGAFFSWMYGSSTRNAGIIYLYMEKLLQKQQTGQAPVYMGHKGQTPVPPPVQKPKSAKKGTGFTVGEQQSGYR